MPKFKKNKYQAKGPSQRQLRVGEELRHGLSELFLRNELGDPVIEAASITVSEVRISPDLKNATGFVMPLHGEKKEEILQRLSDLSGMIRTLVAKKMHLRYIPRLNFKIDHSFETASHIDELLRKARARDANLDSNTDSNSDDHL